MLELIALTVVHTLDGVAALRMHLCADEYITVSIDTRTGRITLRDTGGLSAAGRAPQYAYFTEKINENPFAVYDFLVTARFNVSRDNSYYQTL